MKTIFQCRFGLVSWLSAFVVCLLSIPTVWAKDYKQCVVLGIEKPSNKIVFEADNATDTVFLDSKMLFFTTGDTFSVKVTNNCKDPADLYVTVQIPGEGGVTTRYYHYLDTTSWGLPAMALSTDKKPYAEDFPGGASTTLWSFVLPESLSFAGPIVFEAYLLAGETRIGFDAKTIYMNFQAEP